MMEWLAVFLAMAVLDGVWALYTQAIAWNHAVRASLLSVAIILLSGFVARSYVADAEMLIPAGLGAFAGTWLSLKLGPMYFPGKK